MRSGMSFLESLESRRLFAGDPADTGSFQDAAQQIAHRVEVFEAIKEAAVVVTSGKVNVVGVADGYEVSIDTVKLTLSEEARAQFNSYGVQFDGLEVEATRISVDGVRLQYVINPPPHMSYPLSTRTQANAGITEPRMPRQTRVDNIKFDLNSLTTEILS